MPDSSYVEALSHIRTLRTLGICSGYLKPADKLLLKSRLPRIIVSETDASEIDKNTGLQKLHIADQWAQ
jgi:hypothetical protein